MIPYGKQDINNEDIKAVIDVLKSDFLTQGPLVPQFEKAVTEYTGSKYGVAVNSATSALHIACMALGIKEGDIVWTSPITFVASANCALYCGASVDFVDIDKKTFNMCPNKLEKKLVQAKKKNLLPKAIIPVHLAGQSCDMKKIKQLSKKFNFKIIEDASHGIGGKYLNKPIGSCIYSDITVFSFHPVKIITTAEGGMAVTNDKNLALEMAKYRSHGIVRGSKEIKNNDGPWYYEQIDLGFNYRMTDIFAALGISQIKRLDSFVNKRHKIAEEYKKKLQHLDWISLPEQDKKTHSSFHLFIIRINKEKIKISHKEFFEKLRNSGILVNLHYIPLYRHPYYSKMGFKKKDFPESESYYSEAISIPIFPKMKKKEISEVVKILDSPFGDGFQSLF
jgi:UDP-4-amino-4,6-dideoxy-N-acetyl-beta-L-altrosamine transaminase